MCCHSSWALAPSKLKLVTMLVEMCHNMQMLTSGHRFSTCMFCSLTFWILMLSHRAHIAITDGFRSITGRPKFDYHHSGFLGRLIKLWTCSETTKVHSLHVDSQLLEHNVVAVIRSSQPCMCAAGVRMTSNWEKDALRCDELMNAHPDLRGIMQSGCGTVYSIHWCTFLLEADEQSLRACWKGARSRSPSTNS